MHEEITNISLTLFGLGLIINLVIFLYSMHLSHKFGKKNTMHYILFFITLSSIALASHQLVYLIDIGETAREFFEIFEGIGVVFMGIAAYHLFDLVNIK